MVQWLLPVSLYGSTTVLAEGASRVASVLTIYVRPVITPHKIAENHEKLRGARSSMQSRRERGDKERWKDIVRTMDEDASTSEGLSSLCGSLLYQSYECPLFSFFLSLQYR